MNIHDYCAEYHPRQLGVDAGAPAWEIVDQLEGVVGALVTTMGPDYHLTGTVAVHDTATIDPTAQIKGPAIIGPHCFVGPHALLRGGVYLAESVSVGPGCEIKRSLIGPHSALAHFNFVGDSIVGSHVNLEAGAVVANHYNERSDHTIYALVDGEPLNTSVTKFGALIGDRTKLGANAVTSPGTILPPGTVVKRLELIEQTVENPGSN